jgi:ferredoxin
VAWSSCREMRSGVECYALVVNDSRCTGCGLPMELCRDGVIYNHVLEITNQSSVGVVI